MYVGSVIYCFLVLGVGYLYFTLKKLAKPGVIALLTAQALAQGGVAIWRFRLDDEAITSSMAVVACVIWISYFLVSRRVRRTFVNP
jgi:hypothetical protein